MTCLIKPKISTRELLQWVVGSEPWVVSSGPHEVTSRVRKYEPTLNSKLPHHQQLQSTIYRLLTNTSLQLNLGLIEVELVHFLMGLVMVNCSVGA